MLITKNNLNNNFKQTEIGLIPEDWEVVKLGEIAKISSGGSAPQGEEYFNGKNPFIRVQHIEEGADRIIKYDLITDEAVKKYKLKLYPKEAIIFPKSGASIYLEKRAMLPLDAYIVSHLCVVISKDPKVEQKFLFYGLKNIKLSKEKVDGYPTLNLSEVKNVKISLPLLPEQQKIVKVLSKIQQAIDQQDKIIEATKNLKKSLMQKLFTDGIGYTEFKETEIGQIPKSWEVVKFENTILKKRIKVGKIKQQEYKKIGECPVIDQSQNYIAGYTDKKDKLYQGVLPVIIFGDHTRIFKFVDFPFVAGADGVKVILPDNSKFDSKFFYYAMLNLKIESRGYNRHYPLLREKKISHPPLSEQQEIAHILNTVDKKIETEEKKKATLKELFKTMLNKLMTGEIRLKDIEL